MRTTMKKMIMSILLIMMVCSICGCGADYLNNNQDNLSADEVARLPEQQQKTETEEAIMQQREFRKNSVIVDGDSTITASNNADEIPGQPDDIPDFGNMGESFWTMVTNYVKNEANVPARGDYGYDVAQCIDPAMNAIYGDEDKGYANGYENENIYIVEYETSQEGVYSYLILTREDTESTWTIIHDGTSYKE